MITTSSSRVREQHSRVMPAQILPNNPAAVAAGSINQADMNAAAARVQAAVRGRSVRNLRRDWADRQLAAIGEAPIDAPHARQSEADSYPLYCIPVSTFLGLGDKDWLGRRDHPSWVPHQEALEQGLLVEYDEATMADLVIFISHQWTSWYHPDPKGDQLRALKFSIEKLLEGQTAVRSNPQLEMKYSRYINNTGAWWKQMLPKMFLWIDFFSMPQPLAARFKGMSKEQIDESMAEVRPNPDHPDLDPSPNPDLYPNPAPDPNPDLTQEAKAKGEKPAHFCKCMDHRQVDAKEVEVRYTNHSRRATYHIYGCTYSLLTDCRWVCWSSSSPRRSTASPPTSSAAP